MSNRENYLECRLDESETCMATLIDGDNVEKIRIIIKDSNIWYNKINDNNDIWHKLNQDAKIIICMLPNSQLLAKMYYKVVKHKEVKCDVLMIKSKGQINSIYEIKKWVIYDIKSAFTIIDGCVWLKFIKSKTKNKDKWYLYSGNIEINISIN